MPGPHGEAVGDRASGESVEVFLAALELNGREGLSALTNRRVANAARVSLGTLTYHFESQRRLLQDALELFLDEEVERLSHLTAQIVTVSLNVDQAAQALEALLQTETERRAAKMELYLQASRDPELGGAARRCFEAYDQLAATALEALQIPNATHVAAVLVAVIDGLQLRRLANGEEQLEIAAPLQSLLAGLQRQS